MRPESNPSVILGFLRFVIKKLGKDFEKFFKQNFVFDGNVSIALLVLCDFHKNHFGFFFVNLILRNECSVFRTFLGEGHDMPKVFFTAVFGQKSHGFKLGGIIKFLGLRVNFYVFFNHNIAFQSVNNYYRADVISADGASYSLRE